MADPRGFLEVQRRLGPLRAPLERLGDYRDVHLHAPEGEVREQARRCMSCGVPFCHTGCPLGNLIPDWNDLVHRGRWQEASERLHSTNSFPELTGKLCPAPCEESCVLTINDDAVTIKEIEWAIVERAWEEGWIVPQPAADALGPHRRRDRLGPGRAGRGAAAGARRPRGDGVRARRPRGRAAALRHPRLQAREGADRPARRAARAPRASSSRFGVAVGRDVPFRRACARATTRSCSRRAHSGTGGSRCPGADLAGVHLAMEYLVQQNRRVAGLPVTGPELSARGLRVAILGGGDTSADCLGNVLREGCAVGRRDRARPDAAARARTRSGPGPSGRS